MWLARLMGVPFRHLVNPPLDSLTAPLEDA